MEGCGHSWQTKSAKSQNILDTSGQYLDIIYTNAQSIINKIDELRTIANDLNPHLILINESWTNGSITKSFLKINGFKLVSRKDRTDTEKGRGGGLLIYSKIGMVVEEVDILSEFNHNIHRYRLHLNLFH